jgi:hypothetical protein
MRIAYQGHQRIDRRSLALRRAIADKLGTDPALFKIARDNLDRWSTTGSRSDDGAAAGDPVRGRAGARGALGHLCALRIVAQFMTRAQLEPISYYAHGVDETTAVLPSGWPRRWRDRHAMVRRDILEQRLASTGLDVASSKRVSDKFRGISACENYQPRAREH